MTDVGIAAFLDREAAIAAVVDYATALDARDWPAYRALFTDQIAIDYGAIGSIMATIAADEWTKRCRALEGFDATAHQLHNLVAVVDGDTAQVTGIVNAVHFVTTDQGVLMPQLIGRYHHQLKRSAVGWLISGVALGVVGYPGGQDVFVAGFAASRAIFSSRTSA
jgi:hypothetical protein